MFAPLIRKENETKFKIYRGTNFSFIPTPSWATYCKTSARTREKEWTILGHDSVSLESFLIASWGFYEQGAGLLKSCNVCLLGTTASSFDTLASSSLSSSIRDIINVNIMATTIKMTTATRQMKTLKKLSVFAGHFHDLDSLKWRHSFSPSFTFVNLFPLLLQIISDLFRDIKFIKSINKKIPFCCSC